MRQTVCSARLRFWVVVIPLESNAPQLIPAFRISSKPILLVKTPTQKLHNRREELHAESFAA